ncbi:MAG: hypothetical protein AAGK97_05490 [Bacteroidota bacterium]
MKFSVLLFILFSLQISAQHNFIFNGGKGNGFDFSITKSIQYNSIFNGATNDGFSERNYYQESNNKFYNGGEDDGYAFACLKFLSSSLIFLGGSNDGWSTFALIQKSSSKIFEGGIEDGFANNSLFMPINSYVFDGSNGDGFSNSGISKVTWTGKLSDEWLMADNWYPKQVPGPEISAYIPEVRQQFDYPLLKMGVFGTNTTFPYSYACKHLYIAKNAEMTLGPETFGNINGIMIVEGVFYFLAADKNMFRIGPDAEIQIKSSGRVYMFQ